MKIPVLVLTEHPDVLIKKLQTLVNPAAPTDMEQQISHAIHHIIEQINNGKDPVGTSEQIGIKVRQLAIYAAHLEGNVLVNGKDNISLSVLGRNLNITT